MRTVLNYLKGIFQKLVHDSVFKNDLTTFLYSGLDLILLQSWQKLQGFITH